MTAAIHAPNALARARIAARAIRAGQTNGRAFSACFEMGDGDDVVVALLRRAKTDPVIRTYAISAAWIVAPGTPLASPIYEVDPTLAPDPPFDTGDGPDSCRYCGAGTTVQEDGACSGCREREGLPPVA